MFCKESNLESKESFRFQSLESQFWNPKRRFYKSTLRILKN
ncbi:hypothetical protein [Helicobacter sp. MIT 05-5294]|nr:hypothetical protein [Helicobacter sp. MIT 05-5294]